MNFEQLSDFVANQTALRVRVRLQPAGGQGDVVYPPTYADGSTRHDRVIGGARVPCVLLDSVASQANRMELALRDHTAVPRLSVTVEDYTVTSLDAPHRFTDVILRSCEGYPADALQNRDHEQIFGYSPQSLLMGCWHSNRRGASGLRIPRSIASEIVAVDVADSPHVASRVDPLPFSKKSKVSKHESVSGWKKGGAGKPSDMLLGNIPPSIDEGRGITMDYAEQVCVISLPAIRNLEISDTAKAAVVALGLVGFQLAFANGCWLRSRCHLVPETSPAWEVVPNAGAPLTIEPNSLFEDAVAAIASAGLPWNEVTELTPAEDLVKLVEEGKASLGTGGDE